MKRLLTLCILLSGCTQAPTEVGYIVPSNCLAPNQPNPLTVKPLFNNEGLGMTLIRKPLKKLMPGDIIGAMEESDIHQDYTLLLRVKEIEEGYIYAEPVQNDGMIFCFSGETGKSYAPHKGYVIFMTPDRRADSRRDRRHATSDYSQHE